MQMLARRTIKRAALQLFQLRRLGQRPLTNTRVRDRGLHVYPMAAIADTREHTAPIIGSAEAPTLARSSRNSRPWPDTSASCGRPGPPIPGSGLPERTGKVLAASRNQSLEFIPFQRIRVYAALALVNHIFMVRND